MGFINIDFASLIINVSSEQMTMINMFGNELQSSVELVKLVNFVSVWPIDNEKYIFVFVAGSSKRIISDEVYGKHSRLGQCVSNRTVGRKTSFEHQKFTFIDHQLATTTEVITIES